MSGAGMVWVVGSANVDYVVTAKRLPAAGETVSGGTFSQSGGGKGANQAVAAARAGADVVFTAAVGIDHAGDSTLAELAAYGIDISHVERLEGVATGVALIAVDEHGENLIAVASGANSLVTPDAVRRSFGLLDRAPDVCLIALEIPMESVVAAAQLASAAGATVVVNPAPAQPLPDELYACRPILTPNTGEARMLTGVDDLEQAARSLAARTGAAVVVTRGPSGVLVVDGDAVVARAGLQVPVVDATGAGDVFSGTLAAALALGRPLLDAVDDAQAASARCVGHPGARPQLGEPADSA